ncbi:bifunctional protein HldE [Tersicoccus solisilvae]|uniref:Bifunctional protein HldE n=1 Tax=Tersicoccus solisilvae TaxID=1882339 RepID=A0ABQ1NPA6_9MICC|nr:PfkB family carbohydrate kinase [Tersicoccus solisilvae]GGC81830.1 bifunctional protein HldE [Tersicoccus solisilvae]
MSPRIVVVGDVMLDRDLVGTSTRLSPDAPVPVVDVDAVLSSPGGAGLTALLCAAGDGGSGREGTAVDVTLVAPVADDAAGRELVDALPGVTVHRLGHDGPTRTKTRIRSSGQAMLRVDEGGPGAPVDVDANALTAVLAGADVVLVSDYGGGTTRDPAVRKVLADHAAHATVVWDPHPRGGAPVPGCTLITPNAAEAEAATAGVDHAPALPTDALPTDALPTDALPAGAAPKGADGTGADTGGTGEHTCPDGDAAARARALRAGWRAHGVAVTVGADGAHLATNAGVTHIPAAPVESTDPCGAGDRFAATAALTLATGGTLDAAVEAAVESAGQWVAAGGALSFRAGLRARERAAARPADPALPAEVRNLVDRVRASGGTVVATGGCFDVLHAGHIACLDAARNLGDALVVLLNSDDSVRRLKGSTRPVVGQADRARVLAALRSVDAVVVFDQDDPRAALAALRPDVWVKGGDYLPEQLPEADVVAAGGGRVTVLPYLSGRSTSAILARAGRETRA